MFEPYHFFDSQTKLPIQQKTRLQIKEYKKANAEIKWWKVY